MGDEGEDSNVEDHQVEHVRGLVGLAHVGEVRAEAKEDQRVEGGEEEGEVDEEILMEGFYTVILREAFHHIGSQEIIACYCQLPKVH